MGEGRAVVVHTIKEANRLNDVVDDRDTIKVGYNEAAEKD